LRMLPDAVALDRKKFDECLADEAVRDKVQASANEASDLGVRSTPTIFLGVPVRKGFVQVSAVVQGALSTSEFGTALDAILGDTRKGWRSWLPFNG
jgi:predicted DsbA family dithiol-disulfide isomerase